MIVLSMTSYPKRITNVATSIELMRTKQTVKPDKIFLFLSIEEFPNKEQDLPEDLQKTISEKKVELVWLEKNTFVHKRHEVFNYVNDEDLVFFIDDDVQYDDKLIETVLNAHNKYTECVVCYNRYSMHVYDGIKIIYKNGGDYNKPRYDTRICGQSMWPARLFPKEILSDEYKQIRDKCCPICDESWLGPFVVKYNIPLYHCNFNWGKDIDKNIKKEDGLVKYSHQIEENGYERRDNWLYNVLKSFPEIMNIYKTRFNYRPMKEYKGEKGIITLTTWTARVNTVYRTIENLLEMCPGFHIVLVLSEEEFPNKEADLPESLKALMYRIEIMWVKKNWKAFKKVVFTLRKYPNVPVISADDDCLYIYNYAQVLYDTWKEHGWNAIKCVKSKCNWPIGAATLYYNIDFPIESLDEETIQKSNDDVFYGTILKERGITLHDTGREKLPFIFHNTEQPITRNQNKNIFWKSCFNGTTIKPDVKTEGKHLVFIQYKFDPNSREIVTAVNSFKKHAKFEYEMFFLGDGCPWLEDIPVIYGDKDDFSKFKCRYQHIHVARDLQKVCNMFSETHKEFCLMSDDFFCINDFTWEDLLIPKFNSYGIKGNQYCSPLFWGRAKWRTGQLLMKRGYTPNSYTTHTFAVYDIEKLNDIIEKYNLTQPENDYTIEDLYGNEYLKDADIVTKWRVQFLNEPNRPEDIMDAKKKGIKWINFGAGDWVNRYLRYIEEC